jgi:GntP family gluconate:H+ symporter
MQVSLFQFVIFLLLGIGLIFILSIRYRLPAFYSLLLACLLVGFGFQQPTAKIIGDMKEGFGAVMRSLGFIIVLGTALGILLGKTGSSHVMAAAIQRLTGRKKAAMGISITGFIVGLPVFCDSGYIVLNGLNQSLSKESRTPLVITSICLATGLLSVHCLVPPHPGAAAAAATLQVDYGRLMSIGILVAIPAMFTGYFWASRAGRKYPAIYAEDKNVKPADIVRGPSVIRAFLPVIVPILLIAIKSFLPVGNTGALYSIASFAGDPVIALLIGMLIAFSNKSGWTREEVSHVLSDAVEKAGGILVIIGAGGSFGAVLSSGRIGEQAAQHLPLTSLGLVFPFLLTVMLKTAQGSSTVAIITAASIVQALLPSLGLESENGRLLTVLAMGAGSMIISQANDAYFWVISRFSGIEVRPMLRVYSIATLLMGVVSFGMVLLLSLILTP